MIDHLSMEDIDRLLQILATIADRHDCDATDAIDRLARAAGVGQSDGRRSVIEFAAEERHIRLRRNEIFGAPVFRDPAWDILLDLLVAGDRGERLSVNSVCLGSGVPSTTALNHIRKLLDHGLIERVPDANDQRRIWLRLMPNTAIKLAAILARFQACA